MAGNATRNRPATNGSASSTLATELISAITPAAIRASRYAWGIGQNSDDADLKPSAAKQIATKAKIGPPVVDMLYKRAQEVKYRGKLLPVQLVSSNANARVHTDDRRNRQHLTVPKRDIVSTLNIFQQRRVILGACDNCGGTGEIDD